MSEDITIENLSSALTRHYRDNNQSWMGRWEDRPWVVLKLGRREVEVLDAIACCTTYSAEGVQAMKDGQLDPIVDGRSWCKGHRVKIREIDADSYFEMVWESP